MYFLWDRLVWEKINMTITRDIKHIEKKQETKLELDPRLYKESSIASQFKVTEWEVSADANIISPSQKWIPWLDKEHGVVLINKQTGIPIVYDGLAKDKFSTKDVQHLLLTDEAMFLVLHPAAGSKLTRIHHAILDEKNSSIRMLACGEKVFPEGPIAVSLSPNQQYALILSSVNPDLVLKNSKKDDNLLCNSAQLYSLANFSERRAYKDIPNQHTCGVFLAGGFDPASNPFILRCDLGRLSCEFYYLSMRGGGLLENDSVSFAEFSKKDFEKFMNHENVHAISMSPNRNFIHLDNAIFDLRDSKQNDCLKVSTFIPSAVNSEWTNDNLIYQYYKNLCMINVYHPVLNDNLAPIFVANILENTAHAIFSRNQLYTYRITESNTLTIDIFKCHTRLQLNEQPVLETEFNQINLPKKLQEIVASYSAPEGFTTSIPDQLDSEVDILLNKYEKALKYGITNEKLIEYNCHEVETQRLAKIVEELEADHGLKQKISKAEEEIHQIGIKYFRETLDSVKKQRKTSIDKLRKAPKRDFKKVAFFAYRTGDLPTQNHFQLSNQQRFLTALKEELQKRTKQRPTDVISLSKCIENAVAISKVSEKFLLKDVKEVVEELKKADAKTAAPCLRMKY